MFAFTDDDRWVPGIGDPTAVGWITVLAYLAAALWCGWAGYHSARETRSTRRRWFWYIFAVGLFLLGINKQLDLQTWFTLFVKHLAIDEGWYAKRQTAQLAFIGGVAVAGVGALCGLKFLAGRITGPILTALSGGLFLVSFVLIRASSFHHVDWMLGLALKGLRINAILELGSISMIALGAWWACLQSAQPPPPLASAHRSAPE